MSSSPAVQDVLASRYRLDALVGVGGMAKVYRARDLRLDRAVAVKVFRPDIDATDSLRFAVETRVLSALAHPGLIPIQDTGVHDGHGFLVLRLVNGPTLRREIADGALPVDRVRHLGAQLADALAHVHANGVVHRDVKPSNILLDEGDRAVLADFGLARVLGTTRLTRSDHMAGTAAYLAPEQVTGTEVDCPADIYALGLVLLECLTARREYEGGDVETAVARLHRPPQIPRTLPPPLVRLLLLMTSLAPHRRPTAEACAEALRSDASPVVLPPAPVVVAPTKRSRTPLVVLATAATTLAASGALYWAFKTPTPAATPPALTPPTTSTTTTATTQATQTPEPTTTTRLPKPVARQPALATQAQTTKPSEVVETTNQPVPEAPPAAAVTPPLATTTPATATTTSDKSKPGHTKTPPPQRPK
ncbi:serine/threonine-protein kinase [Actinokineospora auranticolor]|uniref:non-specific serine/threonine protein kinase n=1 Tax=Actinokineospora auranticolor TaxID=155976 RepID=A0A2S6H1G6_9PSEU|nr:serine/threonine-protein kinase [Actinokineospora auranticolor]PPK71257.1 serine/threonine protein kinase [Actinokineospora auranticolor]